MDSIKKLTDLFSEFPTIGPRTAGRFVFYLLKLSPEKIDELAKAICEIKNKVKLCKSCFNHYEYSDSNNSDLCDICGNSSRNSQLLCVVEKEADLISIENVKNYNGFYFVLGEKFLVKKNNIEDLRIEELKIKINNSQKLTEIIIATNPTPEGKVISVLIERELRGLTPQSLKITHLAKGLPVGGELEY